MNEKTEPEGIPGLHVGADLVDRAILRPETIQLNGRDPDTLKTQVTFSEGLADWLGELRIGIAFTTFAAGGLHLVGQDGAGRLTLVQGRVELASGLAYNGRDLCVATDSSIRLYKNIRTTEKLFEGVHDRVFVPRVGYTLGKLDVHELRFDRSGRLLFVNTNFSCVATMHATHSFTPVWRPPFISKLDSEDRCHLSGMAFVDGELHYATAFAASDDGWRGKPADGGIVLDTRTNAIVAEGLMQPHSPRFHAGALWALDSGRGHLVRMDPASRSREPVAFVPGFARGLSFFDKYAALTCSRLRPGTAADRELGDTLKARALVPWCAVLVVDVTNGEIVHWIRLDGLVREMADVLFLTDTLSPWVGTLTSIGTPVTRSAAVPAPPAPAPMRRAGDVAAAQA
jgi:uncharacterized protein (TIGR03032 family)